MRGHAEIHPAVRWAVLLVVSGATAGMVAVSMRANFLFGYGFGQTTEKAQVFGWANVATDIWKVTGLIVVGSLWRTSRRRLVLLLFPIWGMCLAWGMIGAIGIYAQDRSALIGSREGTALSYTEAQCELRAIEARLSGLTQRSVEQVDAAIASALARPVRLGDRIPGTVGTRSGNCVRYDRATIDACAEVARLREERVAAGEAERLRARIAFLRPHIEDMRRGGGAIASDPGAELIAWLSRGQLQVRDITFGFPLIFALLIELISAFGPAAIAAFAESTRGTRSGEGRSETKSAVARRGELRPTVARLGAPELVIRWMNERTEPTTVPMAVSVQDLKADFDAWCDGYGFVAVSHAAFERELDRIRTAPELARMIRKFGSLYYGIRLAGGTARLIGRS